VPAQVVHLHPMIRDVDGAEKGDVAWHLELSLSRNGAKKSLCAFARDFLTSVLDKGSAVILSPFSAESRAFPLLKTRKGTKSLILPRSLFLVPRNEDEGSGTFPCSSETSPDPRLRSCEAGTEDRGEQGSREIFKKRMLWSSLIEVLRPAILWPDGQWPSGSKDSAQHDKCQISLIQN
jgi:hypothetical protein